jgi:branched-chain amino acid transport system substrate-binding protein
VIVKFKNAVAVFLLLASAVFAASGCSPKQGQELITIGALLPLTGEDSDEGFRALNGLQLAKEEININGGILGKKLDVIVLNDRSDEEYIVEQYNNLKKRGIVAVIGSSYSSATLALAKEAEKDGLPIISPTATSPDVTKGRSNVFRAIFIDDYQAEVMAYFAYNSLGARTAAVLSNQDVDQFKKVAEIFSGSFKALGGIVAADVSYSAKDDFADIVASFAASPPDVIFCPNDYVPASKLVNAVYEADLTSTRVLGIDNWDGLLAYVYHPGAMENVYYSAPFAYDDHDEEVTQFVRGYFDFFTQMPLSGSATAYTCVYILAEAIKTAGNTNRESIVAAMKANELDLITGHLKFDENNNPRTNVYIIQIKDGVYSTYEKLSLSGD